MRRKTAAWSASRHGVPLVVLALLVPLLMIVAHPAPVSAASAQTVSRFSTSQPIIVLTFDTDSIRGYTEPVLNTLAAKGVRASFGVTGVFAANNPDLVRRMVNEGHSLMNHSYDHPDFTRISSASRADQLRRTENAIRNAAGVNVQPLFRPPYGAYNGSVLADLGANGYTYNIMWSVDPQGWRGKSGAEITQLILAGAAPGAIVLMHTTNAGDSAALAGTIDQLRARGYRFATVADFLGGTPPPPPPPPPPPEERFFSETGFWISHGFLRYWERFGGLSTFGYPISAEFSENGVTVQYFQRARFEWHPGEWPERYDVLLGLLGREITADRQAEPPFERVLPVGASAPSNPNCTYFSPTGHWLCSGFRTAWEQRGGLGTFGYPISEEFTENGFTVQYFERQRFEYHPENKPPWDVEGGLLGSQVLAVHNAE